MLTPQFILPLADEIIVDLFAGGGGASTGIEQAVGRETVPGDAGNLWVQVTMVNKGAQ